MTLRDAFLMVMERAGKDWNEVNFVTSDDDIREKGLGNDCCY